MEISDVGIYSIFFGIVEKCNECGCNACDNRKGKMAMLVSIELRMT